MKIEKVNENKIQVTLTLTDLREHNIDFRSFSYNSPQTQELFWNMMHKAEIEYGFSASNSQLFIEARAGMNENKLIVTITKITGDDDFESIHKYIKNKFKKSELKVRKKHSQVSSGILIYFFEQFDDLCAVAKIISDQYFGDSTLYKHNEGFYLLLTNNGIANTNPLYFSSIMTEYSTLIENTSFYEGFLNEYAKKIIENNALSILKDYF